MTRISSLSERPGRHGPRRLADWLNPTGEKKVDSLVDKIYQRKNLELAWKRVKSNRGASGVDGQSLEQFEEQREVQLDRLHEELKGEIYRPQPVRQHLIPKAGQPTGSISRVRHPHDLRSGLSASDGEPVGSDLRAGI